MGISIKLAGQCLSCDSPNIKDVAEDRMYTRGGVTMIVPRVPHEKCFNCGEKTFDKTSYDYIDNFFVRKKIIPYRKKNY